jgi:hypothetical protein
MELDASLARKAEASLSKKGDRRLARAPREKVHNLPWVGHSGEG